MVDLAAFGPGNPAIHFAHVRTIVASRANLVWFFYAWPPYSPFVVQRGRRAMADILVIVLGTGAILLMAAYAELCERI